MKAARFRAATLAIGTEVTDGQILDRNSALLSKRIARLGFEVIEHRAVPDDQPLIMRALANLTQDPSEPLHVLFVTGGLGPTSDDFTRDVLATFFKRELEYDAGSWTQIEERLQARGIVVGAIQKQQCFFPRGASILFNPAGTANGFMFMEGALWVIVLPGPPSEIEAIWDHSLNGLLKDLVPPQAREELHIWQCLGRGESEIAERVERAIKDSGLRVGYRVHLPYVEVKLWTPFEESASEKAAPFVKALAHAISPWVVAQGAHDAAADFLASPRAQHACVIDQATQGLLAGRFAQALTESKLAAPANFRVQTLWQLDQKLDGLEAHEKVLQPTFLIRADLTAQVWKLGWAEAGDSLQSVKLEVIEPPHRFRIESERGRKYVCERALLWANDLKS
jgi:nicotinamide-nucleotide amidase